MQCASFKFLFLMMTFLSIWGAPTAHALEYVEAKTITVMAENGLAIPLSQIASTFTRNTFISVSNHFGDSSQQKKKIEDGESADIFITSQADLVQQLKTKGLVDIYSIGKIASQKDKTYTVAVVAGENMTPARVFLDFLKSEDAKSIFNSNGLATP